MTVKDKLDFRSILHKVGYKATPARLSVMKLLKEAKKPLSPQTIVDAVSKDADQATTYRILKALKTTGVIRQIDFQHSHPHYELANRADHHHLVCITCGEVEDVEGCDIESMEKTVLRKSKKFTEIERHSLEFFGVCNKCSKK